MPEALLVGNNLAVLVAAVELGAAGHDVVLVTDGRGPGGHFRGLRTPEADFDLGMVLLESAGSTADDDLATYRPRVRYDWTRFGARVDRWQAELVRPVRTPTPEALVEGRRRPDHLVADRLDVLAEGGFRPPAPLPREDPRHASAKVAGAAYDALPYREAAAANHGEDIHARLVEPFAEKLLGPAAGTLLARYHRAGWLPLYWPETLAAACAGQPTGLAEYPFWTTPTGFVGDVVRTLETRLAAMPTVQVHDGAVTSLALEGSRWTAATADGSWSSERPVLGVGADRLQTLLGLPVQERAPGASVALVCCLVRGAAITEPVGCLSVVDREYATYRVTDQDALAGLDPAEHRVVVEAGPATAARLKDGADVPGELVAELGRLLGITDPSADVRVVKAVAAPGAVPAPTAASVAAEATASDALTAACPGALLTGALLGGGATSMNDQVVQGLAVAAQLP
ncbi:hypothetical protein JKP75_03045 [Blastococcus sp. TML/M2B]|uniref:hypothetical protein n=1 Tax=unclassified Blastococcus TaxID=2619396 RepID=UPI00190D4BBE|nr:MULTISPECIES: hypothetical protein [unclassified Blastococcus]MBN1091638.1 hypothetical protein [Blastococcus sp. TML/M2B]MBN1094807.1 hypothetical protein [Blastococcus sp. TML/C7B]